MDATTSGPAPAQVALFKALAAARRNFAAIRKDRENTHLRNRYATIGAILEAVEGPLLDAGILVIQHDAGEPAFDGAGGGMLPVRTDLVHVDGGMLSCTIPAVWSPNKLNEMQAMGSAISYARRYGLLSVLCLTTDDDDDGAGAGPGRGDRDGRRGDRGGGRGRFPVDQRAANGRGNGPTAAGFDAFADRKIAGFRKWCEKQGVPCPEKDVHPSRMLHALTTAAIEAGGITPDAVTRPNGDGDPVRQPGLMRRALGDLAASSAEWAMWLDTTATRYLKGKVASEEVRATEGGNDD